MSRPVRLVCEGLFFMWWGFFRMRRAAPGAAPWLGEPHPDRAESLHFYRISGLSVSSEIVLPGLSAAAAGRRRADVAIRRGAVPATLDGAEKLGPTWQMAGKEFLLRVPKVARFLPH